MGTIGLSFTVNFHVVFILSNRRNCSIIYENTTICLATEFFLRQRFDMSEKNRQMLRGGTI
jgi:hypothetical protein